MSKEITAKEIRSALVTLTGKEMDKEALAGLNTAFISKDMKSERDELKAVGLTDDQIDKITPFDILRVLTELCPDEKIMQVFNDLDKETKKKIRKEVEEGRKAVPRTFGLLVGMARITSNITALCQDEFCTLSKPKRENIDKIKVELKKLNEWFKDLDKEVK